MSCARPDLLWLLLAAPALVAAAAAARVLRRLALARFAVSMAGGAVRGARQALLPAAALALVLLALCGPRWGERLREAADAGTDVVVLLDASRSMWVRDDEPDRLGRARREALDLAQCFAGGRLGLVTFGGSGELHCPLTHDRAGFASFVRAVDPALTSRGGTDVAAGVRRALAAFDQESAARRVIVLISDGEDLGHRAQAEGAGWLAYSMGAVVHALLVGSRAGGPVPERSEPGAGFLLDAAGAAVISLPDPATLRALAQRTGGEFLEAEREPFALRGLHDERLADTLLAGSGTALRREPVDRYQWFLAAAALVLLLGNARRLRRAALAAPLLLVAAWSGAADLERRAIDLFAAGELQAALELFEQAAREEPESAPFAYNLAVASERAGDATSAARAFQRARSLARAELRARACFGSGVARARQALALAGSAARADRPAAGRAISLLIGARRDFIEALELGLGADAAVNLELVSTRLQELLELERDGGRPGGEEPAGEESAEAQGEPESGASAAAPEGGEGLEQAGGEEGTPAGEPPSAGDSAAAAGGDSARLPGGMFREEAGNLEDIVKRYEAELFEHDRRRARAGRARVERDW
ncbi:MAG: VWA domain-containing protein [Planctomycetes bacterium]|nr:VWA domain-containing protein [Planctomycetota bacterium]